MTRLTLDLAEFRYGSLENAAAQVVEAGETATINPGGTDMIVTLASGQIASYDPGGKS